MIIFNKLGMKENFLNLINQFLKPKIMSYLSEMLNFLSLRSAYYYTSIKWHTIVIILYMFGNTYVHIFSSD